MYFVVSFLVAGRRLAKEYNYLVAILVKIMIPNYVQISPIAKVYSLPINPGSRSSNR